MYSKKITASRKKIKSITYSKITPENQIRIVHNRQQHDSNKHRNITSRPNNHEKNEMKLAYKN